MIRTQKELFSGKVRIMDVGDIEVNKFFADENFSSIFKGRIKREERTIKIEGEIMVNAKVFCRRCLEEFETVRKEKISIELKPLFPYKKGEEIELKFSNLDEDFYESDLFDFEEYLKSLSEMIIPPYPICSENCQGLCPICGDKKETCNHKK